eukprot:208141_1
MQELQLMNRNHPIKIIILNRRITNQNKIKNYYYKNTMLHESVTLLLLNLLSANAFGVQAEQTWGNIVAFEGRDIMEYWNSNSSVMGHIKYNITSKDDKGIEREYQLWFSTQENLETFKQNQTHYLPQYGGF